MASAKLWAPVSGVENVARRNFGVLNETIAGRLPFPHPKAWYGAWCRPRGCEHTPHRIPPAIFIKLLRGDFGVGE